jgi:hypothetical protein
MFCAQNVSALIHSADVSPRTMGRSFLRGRYKPRGGVRAKLGPGVTLCQRACGVRAECGVQPCVVCGTAGRARITGRLQVAGRAPTCAGVRRTSRAPGRRVNSAGAAERGRYCQRAEPESLQSAGLCFPMCQVFQQENLTAGGLGLSEKRMRFSDNGSAPGRRPKVGKRARS